MTYVFESKVPTLTLEVEPGTVNENGKILTRSKSIQFRGNFFATDNEDTAKAIMSSQMFGEEESGKMIWLRLKSDDGKEITKAQAPKKRGRPRKITSGAVGTTA